MFTEDRTEKWTANNIRNRRKQKQEDRIDPRVTATMIAEEFDMNQETVRLILTVELRMRKLCAKMVSSNLTEQQRIEEKDVLVDLLE